jgi:hypothetical protein
MAVTMRAGAVAACGAPIVGWLAERLGFNAGGGGGELPTDLQRAKALGDAIVICTVVPWALCCLLYSGAGGWGWLLLTGPAMDAAGVAGSPVAYQCRAGLSRT